MAQKMTYSVLVSPCGLNSAVFSSSAGKDHRMHSLRMQRMFWLKCCFWTSSLFSVRLHPSHPQSDIVLFQSPASETNGRSSSAALTGVGIWYSPPFLTPRSKGGYTGRGHIVILTFFLTHFMPLTPKVRS